jgi:hypothetical protein
MFADFQRIAIKTFSRLKWIIWGTSIFKQKEVDTTLISLSVLNAVSLTEYIQGLKAREYQEFLNKKKVEASERITTYTLSPPTEETKY